MTPKPSGANVIRSRLLGLAALGSALWAGFCGLVAWNIFTTDTGAGAVIGGLISLAAAVLPAAVLYFRRKVAVVELPKPEMPKAMRPTYRRLMSAYEQAQMLVVEGVLNEGVLRGIDERIAEILHLLSADVSNEALGGQRSTRLRSQVEELTDLLVGLTDAAVDRRTAALESDNRAAASLREALERMRAEEQGYREIEELGER